MKCCWLSRNPVAPAANLHSTHTLAYFFSVRLIVESAHISMMTRANAMSHSLSAQESGWLFILMVSDAAEKK
jgi:hypothetical protein